MVQQLCINLGAGTGNLYMNLKNQTILDIINNAEIIDPETIELILERVKESKPLDEDLNKLLSENITELF